ncbi:hypothetical protein [Clostridium saccharoperbutylacetonicum]|uniref:Uncharacterized protein n=1 Tax=Clostridium saccharoperbutylacetonicum N1-4(HMT) TaxID=931276 RepID=M1MEE2_9CLOT|nr:hypothetical protein [Clostridium saccharoperbutylacetonicum]AGF56274.1 hypothetical protein Cspa_c25090 [Clostridium saccharoperbutylacetonicum N1-4(HMT)]AQR95014.1 hypothetical protein CLSAP_23280 [Clostridium saccharoperbutylacetonicum]NRT62983.1 hypothetical protein [Clostridium saccharoperbutylacetonicum]NSB26340.1 hypothetical protein [Clostridium saccharoperbutylacetonicum]NSB30858.1 hypothetical protein [Clostridium saccharoperbutylacetonicum]
MEFKGWNSFEDLAKACGYANTNKDNTNKTQSKSSNTSNNMGCSDIPNGFQCLNPALFVVIGEILGNIIAGSIPYNVQNALGNWLELVGQAILTYNSQQQYFQGGPGRYFSPLNYNVNNPFCNTNPTNTNQDSISKNDNKSSKNKKEHTPDSSINTDTIRLAELEACVNQLKSEIEQLKNKLDN